MRIEQLYYLQEIARTRSISLAAKNLYLSQQSLSAALAALEEEFHLQLFIRSRKGVTMTEKGEAFLQDAQHVLDAVQRLKQNYTKNSFSELVICGNSQAHQKLLPVALTQFSQKYPQIKLHISEEGINQTIIEKVIRHEIDLGIATIYAQTFAESALYRQFYPASFRYEILYQDELHALVSLNSPLADQASISLSELLRYPLVLNRFSNMEATLAAAAPKEKMNILLRTNSAVTYMNMIQNNLAVGFTTKISQQQHFQGPQNGSVAIPLKEPLSIEIALFTANSRPLSQAAENFRQLLLHLSKTSEIAN